MEQELSNRLAKIEAQLAKSKNSHIWDILFKAAVPLVISIGAWAISKEVELSHIKSTYMSLEQGMAMERRMLENMPPQWLKEDLVEIKNILKVQDARLRDIEVKIR